MIYWSSGLTLAAVLLVAVLYSSKVVYAYRRRAKTVPRVVLAGLQRSGKTILWQQLTASEPPRPTVASVEPNMGYFLPSTAASVTADEARRLFGKIEICDTPGHSAAQMDLVNDRLWAAMAIVFVINSTDKASMREAASYLFSILTSPAWQKLRQPLCLVLNRQWDRGARHRNLIREDLEREIERLHRSLAQAPRRAHIPSGANFVKSFLGKITRGYYTRFAEYKKSDGFPSPVSLTRQPRDDGIFRFSDLNCKLMIMVHETSNEANIMGVKGFIQRAVLCR